MIYDFNNNKSDIIINDQDKYSFTATSNGMSIIYINEERFLICACKSYNDHDRKNGILLINIKDFENKDVENKDFKDKDFKDFKDTKEFEVYCFCQLMETTNMNNSTRAYDINEKQSRDKGTEYILVGGFDKILREGKIKLFKIIPEKEKDKLIFLQDIEIEKSNKWTETEEEMMTEEESNNEIKEGENKGKKEENKKLDKYKFYGFHGAISSIIQSSTQRNILVSCYDGKVYLFTKPNLSLYDGKDEKNKSNN